MRSIWKKYYEECHGVIYLIDGSDNNKYGESLNAFKDVINNDNLSEVPILIIINKNVNIVLRINKIFLNKL